MNPVKNGQFWHSGGQNWRCLSKATNSGSPWPESALLSSVPFFFKEFVWIDRFYEKKRKLYFPKSMHFLLKKIGWVKKNKFLLSGLHQKIPSQIIFPQNLYWNARQKMVLIFPFSISPNIYKNKKIFFSSFIFFFL